MLESGRMAWCRDIPMSELGTERERFRRVVALSGSHQPRAPGRRFIRRVRFSKRIACHAHLPLHISVACKIPSSYTLSHIAALPRTMSTLISVPAGRCLRRSLETKWIDPQPDKGLIEMKFEDDLMHLCGFTSPLQLFQLLAAEMRTHQSHRVEEPRLRSG